MINALLFERPIWFTTGPLEVEEDRKSTRLNSSHSQISYAVFCLKKKNNKIYLFHMCEYHDVFHISGYSHNQFLEQILPQMFIIFIRCADCMITQLINKIDDRLCI